MQCAGVRLRRRELRGSALSICCAAFNAPTGTMPQQAFRKQSPANVSSRHEPYLLSGVRRLRPQQHVPNYTTIHPSSPAGCLACLEVPTRYMVAGFKARPGPEASSQWARNYPHEHSSNVGQPGSRNTCDSRSSRAMCSSCALCICKTSTTHYNRLIMKFLAARTGTAAWILGLLDRCGPGYCQIPDT